MSTATDFRSFVHGLAAHEAPTLIALREMLGVADAGGSVNRAQLVDAFHRAYVRHLGESDAARARAQRMQDVRKMTPEDVDRYLDEQVLTRLAADGWIRVDGEAGGARVEFAPEVWRQLGSDADASRVWLTEELDRVERTAPEARRAAYGHTLRTDGLVKVYKRRRVVDGVSLELRQGEIVGLLGPNGAGKTTTFYMIVGLIPPDAGRVHIDDEDVTTVPMYKRARKGIGYLAQEPSIFRKLTVEENIRAILETLPVSKEERQARLEGLLDELSIKHLRDHYAYSLSGGERRRLEITRALVTEPKFILLDEPFAGVDPIAVNDIQRIVAGLKRRGLGVVITDHNVRETLSITDRAYILFDGRIHIEGSAETLVNDAQARRLYLGEDFRL
jgi:lipopolysaccharide export system ATP-binding protein